MNNKKFLILLIIPLIVSIWSVSVRYSNDTSQEYVKFQDRMSMDWGGEQEELLLKLATYKRGSVEDRAYNILVTLNRMLDDNYPDTIEEIVAQELYGLNLDEIVIDDASYEAMHKVKIERWDETEGSNNYK